MAYRPAKKLWCNLPYLGSTVRADLNLPIILRIHTLPVRYTGYVGTTVTTTTVTTTTMATTGTEPPTTNHLSLKKEEASS